MTTTIHCKARKVAGSRLATSAQPPRATSAFSPVVSSQQTPQPIRSFLLLDKPDALLEGLRCSTASRPLPRPIQGQRKNRVNDSPCKEGLKLSPALCSSPSLSCSHI